MWLLLLEDNYTNLQNLQDYQSPSFSLCAPCKYRSLLTDHLGPAQQNISKMKIINAIPTSGV